MASQIRYGRVDENHIPKALILSLVVHSLMMLIKTSDIPAVQKLRDNAIKVEFALTPVKVPEKKIVPAPVVAKKVEKVEVVKKKIDAGTLKQVAENKVLGDKRAKVVQKVQKGDPASNDFTAYKPNTDFRKLKAANIGSGGASGIPSAIKAGGSGDTYKGPDFAVKSLSTASLGKRFTINKIDDGGAGTGRGGGIGDGAGRGFGDGTITGTTTGTLQKAQILTNVGSLTGATTGIIGTSKGAEGLSTKGTIALADVPDQAIILGSMDPSVIRQVLLSHLAQFRYCYQSELERADREVSGLLNLNFDIGSNGGVKRVDVTGAQSINQGIKGCVAGVLRGISFPEPKGGGIVEVKQPMNFYSKYN